MNSARRHLSSIKFFRFPRFSRFLSSSPPPNFNSAKSQTPTPTPPSNSSSDSPVYPPLPRTRYSYPLLIPTAILILLSLFLNGGESPSGEAFQKNLLKLIKPKESIRISKDAKLLEEEREVEEKLENLNRLLLLREREK